MTNDRDGNTAKSEEKAPLSPDKETLHTPDPQENMEGPVSSTMQKIAEGFDTNESKSEADRKKEEKM